MNRNKGRKGGSGRGRSGGRGSNSGKRFGGNRGGFRKNNFNAGPREMHKATCSDCKQNCEVPFKPIEGKPIYCKECYSKHKKF